MKYFVLGLGLLAVTIFLTRDHWKSYPPVAEAVSDSLVKADGRQISSFELDDKDYVLLYFSASWCPPCRKFTPELVRFYNQKKEQLNFEVVLVSWDKSEGKMKSYMDDYNMPFPAIPFGESVVKNRLQENYGGRGIPHLVLIDQKGKVLSSSYEGGKYLGPMKVLQDLQNLE